tara:strand:+ start:1819 stop:2625 length:807 start_codon:yes stop_codon:yes gene_type:complete
MQSINNQTNNQSNKSALDTLINQPINSLITRRSNNKSLTDNLPSISIKSNQIESNKIGTQLPKSIQNFSPNFSNNFSNNLENKRSLISLTPSTFFSFKNLLYIIFIILLLAFFGLNIFTYLSEGTNVITRFFSPIFSNITLFMGDATKSTVETTSTGTKKIVETGSDTTKNIVDVASKGTTSGIDFLQDRLKNNKNVVDTDNDDILIDNKKDNSNPEPVKTSSLQQGYCYIGKVNDTRYCAKVDERTKCMSGDIYTNYHSCINPNLKS